MPCTGISKEAAHFSLTRPVAARHSTRPFGDFALRLYPNRPLVPIPANDEFFSALPGLDLTKCQYTKAAGGGKGLPQLEGIKIDGLWGIIYSKFGIGCALDREHDGGCKGYIRDDAVKIGANVFTYSLLP